LKTSVVELALDVVDVDVVVEVLVVVDEGIAVVGIISLKSGSSVSPEQHKI
jgi:hypothetical protein